ncbi:MAG: aldo/keto reductase [Chloroflexi bacterium]|nr:aldo/keto reductase [Chloroflexota bacterium]
MKHVPFGSTSLIVSNLCLGTMQFGWTAGEDASFAVLDAFVAAGGNFLDTADVYSRWLPGHKGGESETIIGKWLKARGNRNAMIVATKCRARVWPGPSGEGLSREHIVKACEYSLRRLQVETIDLYQFHSFDAGVPIEESLRAGEELVRAGKVRCLGASNYPPGHLHAAMTAAGAAGVPGFVSLQPHHNLVHRREYEAGLQSICLEYGLAVIPYSPLAKGFLTGKYTQGGPPVRSARSNAVKSYLNDDGWRVIEALREVAAAHDTTTSAVALAWQLAQPGITAPITGANTAAQLADLLPAADLELTAAELTTLDAASRRFLDA